MIKRFLIFIAIAQLFLGVVHYAVYEALKLFFHIRQPSHVEALQIMVGFLAVSFLVASLLAFKYFNRLVRIIYILAAVWLGTLYWLFWASVVAGLLMGLFDALHLLKVGLYVGKALLVAAGLISLYGVMHSYRTQVKHVSVTLSRVPEYWKNKKAVLFSDSHLGHVRNIGFIRKVVKLINAQQPDIVFIPGDFYDGPPANHVELAAELKNLQSTHGTYFAMGNHEEFRDKSVFLNALKQAGVRVLDNEKVDIQGLQIIGLDYFDTVWSARQAQILNSLFIDRSRPSILLKHVPSHIEVAESAGISLQLSGHTHLGQMFPIGYITKQVYKGFHYGLQGYKTMQILTTSGVGTWGPPQRIGTNSEIVVLSFK